jgi:AcrR family transcriptional regulator
MGTTRERKRRSDGERSRTKILEAAAQLATVEGLDGLSIGQLADHIGMSKSGLYAHFGSKEELQLATIDAAQDVFDQDVVKPALAAGRGVDRVTALCDRFLSHVERGVFPGGCFFASTAAELDTRPGPVRDRVAEMASGFAELIAAALREAQADGDLHAEVDIDQLTFHLDAMLLQANNTWVMYGERRVFGWAQAGIRGLLSAAGSGRAAAAA